jgi:hypothetical protein
LSPVKSRAAATAAMAGLCLLGFFGIVPAGVRAADQGGRPAHWAPPEFGIDRFNMATQWTLAPLHEPNVSPFLASDYNKPGDFEARRVAVLDGIALACASPPAPTAF